MSSRIRAEAIISPLTRGKAQGWHRRKTTKRKCRRLISYVFSWHRSLWLWRPQGPQKTVSPRSQRVEWSEDQGCLDGSEQKEPQRPLFLGSSYLPSASTARGADRATSEADVSADVVVPSLGKVDNRNIVDHPSLWSLGFLQFSIWGASTYTLTLSARKWKGVL